MLNVANGLNILRQMANPYGLGGDAELVNKGSKQSTNGAR